MAKGKDPAQGIVRNPRQPLGKISIIPQRDGKQIIASAARDVARQDARHTTPRHPPQRATQDWRKG